MKNFDTAIILAGGQSSRMGFDKQFLTVDNNLIVHGIIKELSSIFNELIIVTHKPEVYRNYSYKIVEDELLGFGPLSGIHAGLKNSNSLYNYIIGCDMPFINKTYIDYMISIIKDSPEKLDGVITLYEDWIEPFNSFYIKDFANSIENYVKTGKPKIYPLLKKCNIHYVPEKEARKFSPTWQMFMNINTPEDIQNYREIISLDSQ